MLEFHVQGPRHTACLASILLDAPVSTKRACAHWQTLFDMVKIMAIASWNDVARFSLEASPAEIARSGAKHFPVCDIC